MHIIEATEILTLVAAISVDALIAALSYGAENITIPPKSTLIIHMISIGCIWISVMFGQCVSQYIPPNVTKIISALILFVLGVTKLFDEIIKNALQKTENCKKDIHFSLKSLKFILSVYADPKSADADRSKTLSPKEAAVLAVTLSADSLPIGIGLGISAYPVIYVIILAVVADEFALRLGQFLGRKTAENPRMNISWIGGALLIAMSIFKLI